MKILCLGQSAYDITIPVDGFPTENKKIKVKEVIECGGGAANNAAYLLAKWGNEVYFATSIGKDDYGRKIKEELISVGIKEDYINEINDKTTTSYILANKSNGSRTIVTDVSPNMHFDANYDIDLKPDIILFDGNDLDFALRVAKANPQAIKIIDAGSFKESNVLLSLSTLNLYTVSSIT